MREERTRRPELGVHGAPGILLPGQEPVGGFWAELRRASPIGPEENGTHKTAGGGFDLQGGAAKAG